MASIKNGRIMNEDKILAILPNSPKSITAEEFKKCEGFKLFEAADGTTVTIYKREDVWHISTNGNIEAHHVYMFGHNVSEVFVDMLDRIVGENWQDHLSPGTCYSFCFSSYRIHRFQDDGYERVWFIQSINIANAQEAGIIETNISSPFPQIEQQRTLDFAAVNLENLTNAFENYKKTGIKIYGIVAINTSTYFLGDQANPVYVIESNLYKLIKGVLYSNGLNVKFGKSEKQHMIVAITNAYLQNNPLIQHFPTYKHMIDAIDIILNQLVDMIYAYTKVPYMRHRQSSEFGRQLEATARTCHISLSEKHRLSLYEDAELLRMINSYCYSNLILEPLTNLLFKSL